MSVFYTVTGKYVIPVETTVNELKEMIDFLIGYGRVTNSKADIVDSLEIHFTHDIIEDDEFECGMSWAMHREELEQHAQTYNAKLVVGIERRGA